MDLSFYAGDSKNLIVTVLDENNSPITLTGSSIKWVLISQNSIILSKTVSSGITITNAVQGQFKITLTTVDTKNLIGTYQHFVRVTTADGSSSIILTGTITVEESLI
jgi:hypothetical protein